MSECVVYEDHTICDCCPFREKCTEDDCNDSFRSIGEVSEDVLEDALRNMNFQMELDLDD